jgi:tetratricopeptide (TPR) repeat protein
LVLAALLPGQARSQGAVSSAPPIAPAPTTAEQRFAEAQLLFDGQKFAEALPLFEALVGETDSPNARLYVARCLRELGRLTQAYDAMRATVALATEKAKTDDRYVETRRRVRVGAGAARAAGRPPGRRHGAGRARARQRRR